MKWCCFHYLVNMVIYICHGILSDSTHGECFSTACLSISKNTCWKIFCGHYQWGPLEVQEAGKEKERSLYSPLIPLTTERATALAPASYTSLVEASDLKTLSRTWQKQRINRRNVRNQRNLAVLQSDVKLLEWLSVPTSCQSRSHHTNTDIISFKS